MPNIFIMIFYNLFIIAPAELILMLFGRFVPKIQKNLSARKGWELSLEKSVKGLGNGRCVLFHVASAGELQQALPLIKKMKNGNPEIRIGISFYSISGYSFFKGDSEVDFICYMPFDTPRNSIHFMNIVKPDLYVVVAYDAWMNHCIAARNIGAKLIMISGNLSSESSRVKFPTRIITKQTLSLFDKIFTIADEDKEEMVKLLKSDQGIEVVGDPRYDHILNGIAGAEERLSETKLPQWSGERVMTLGSLWEPGWDVVGADLLAEVQAGRLRLFIAPHEMHEELLGKIEKACESLTIPVVRYSALGNTNNVEEYKVVIVNTVGLLAALYSRSSLVYVGGAFGKGVHNVAEPAAFGLPLYFGTNYSRSLEARRAVETGAANVVQETGGFGEDFRRILSDDKEFEYRSERAREVVHSNAGATSKIYDDLINTGIIS